LLYSEAEDIRDSVVVDQIFSFGSGDKPIAELVMDNGDRISASRAMFSTPPAQERYEKQLRRAIYQKECLPKWRMLLEGIFQISKEKP